MNQDARVEFETAYELDIILKRRRLRLFLSNLKLCLVDATQTIERFEKEIKKD